MSKSKNELIAEQLMKVEKELAISDPVYKKSKCPLCHGLGQVTGRLAGPQYHKSQSGICRFCGGTGIARQRKKYDEK